MGPPAAAQRLAVGTVLLAGAEAAAAGPRRWPLAAARGRWAGLGLVTVTPGPGCGSLPAVFRGVEAFFDIGAAAGSAGDFRPSSSIGTRAASLRLSIMIGVERLRKAPLSGKTRYKAKVRSCHVHTQ